MLLPLLLDLQDDEVDDAVTDEFYQAAKGHEKGKDRGIDAIFVDTKYERPSIHLFSCKYSSTFEKTEGFFPSNEINKIETFLGDGNARNRAKAQQKEFADVLFFKSGTAKRMIEREVDAS